MSMNEDGLKVVIILWSLAGLILIWVILRNYTRAILLHSFGMDDVVFNMAFILFMFYAIFITLAAHWGFGRDITNIPLDGTRARAILYQLIGQTFSVIDMALAKWSLGLFLLRLVQKTWHKTVVWTMMLLLMGASMSVVFVTWFRCKPPAFVFNQKISGGYCDTTMMPVSYIFTGLCILADFFFAFFPWLFIWKLNLKRRERITILSSLSLGIFAGVCGIKRTMEIYTLKSPNYSKDTVPLLIWAGVENAVTLICIGIAVCLPLYKRIYTKLRPSASLPSLQKRPNMASVGAGPRLWPGYHPSSHNELSGTTLPGRWSGALTGFEKTRRNKSRRKASAPECPESAPPTVGVWGLQRFDELHMTSLTTSIVGGRDAMDASEDVLASASRGVETVLRTVTDEEALTGVIVTKEFTVSRA